MYIVLVTFPTKSHVYEQWLVFEIKVQTDSVRS